MQHTLLKNYYRHDIVQLLHGHHNIGIELGVAQGVFSERMIKSGRFAHFFGVDKYADMHNTAEYKSALRKTGLFSSYKLLRMRFNEALDLFENHTFDFIYIDGYAHNGEEGGETLFQWYQKLKIGGVIAGDDYHPDWPLVVKAVHTLVQQTQTELMLTEKVEAASFCQYPTWALIKKEEKVLMLDQQMITEGKRTTRKMHRQHIKNKKIQAWLQTFNSLFKKNEKN